MTLRRLLQFIGIMGALTTLAGCAHYQLGTQGKLSFQTLYVAPVNNRAEIPQAAAIFSTQLRETFIKDGRVSLVATSVDADATLEVTLTNLSRMVTSVRRDDTGYARKFDVTVDAVCTLRDNRTGKILFEKRPVKATREIFTTNGSPDAYHNGTPLILSDQLQAEYQNVPLLAATLADRVAHATLDVW